jgi:hypothetical protein
MKFDLSDFQSTQVKIPSIEEVCFKNYFDTAKISNKG